MDEETNPSDGLPSGNERDLIQAARAQVPVETDTPAVQVPLRASAPPDVIPGYELVREIHRGGQGVVYQAIQLSTKRKVAIKVMHEGPFAGPRDRTRFEREVQILGQLNHPNIVAIHDSGVVNGAFYFVMDYISGLPLEAYLAERQLTINETLKLFGEICEAVNAAHLRGVIHRDIKPGNIRVDREGRPHVLDFGLAKIAAADVTDESRVQVMSLTGQFIGSLPWASPEQAEGSPEKIDVRTDVYSLGVILYQMLTGCFPYDVAGNMRDVLDNILRAEPARPSTVRKRIDNEVETIVLKCLSKPRERRYQSAGELARDVARYLAGEPIDAKRDSGWYLLRKSMRRYRGQTTAAAIILVLIVAFGVVMAVQYRQTKIAKAAAEAQAARAEAVKDFLESVLTSVGPDVARGRDTALLMDILDSAAGRVDAALDDQPLAAAEVYDAIGRTFHKIGRRDRAEPFLREALDLREAAYDHTHVDVAHSLIELAYLRKSLGDLAAAEKMYLRALSIFEASTGPDSLEVARALNYLARLREAQGQLDDALAADERALRIRLREHGELHEHVANTRHNIGLLQRRKGDFDGALRYLRAAESVYRQLDTTGRPNPAVARSLNVIGDVLREAGRLDEAESAARESLNTRRAACPPAQYPNGHVDVALSLKTLGRILLEKGDLEDAEAALRECMSMVGALLPPTHVLAGAVRSDLGATLIARGRFDTAESVLNEALRILQTPPVRADEQRLCLERLVQLYDAWGKQAVADGYRARLASAGDSESQ